MKRDEVIATLRAHERELKALGIVRLGVFGSVARGEDTEESDVELMVTFDEAQRHSALDEIRLKRHLTSLLGTDVDLAFEPLQKERFRARVERELVRAF